MKLSYIAFYEYAHGYANQTHYTLIFKTEFDEAPEVTLEPILSNSYKPDYTEWEFNDDDETVLSSFINEEDLELILGNINDQVGGLGRDFDTLVEEGVSIEDMVQWLENKYKVEVVLQ